MPFIHFSLLGKGYISVFNSEMITKLAVKIKNGILQIAFIEGTDITGMDIIHNFDISLDLVDLVDKNARIFFFIIYL